MQPGHRSARPGGRTIGWVFALSFAILMASTALAWAAYTGPSYQLVTTGMVSSDRPAITVGVFGSGHIYFPSAVHRDTLQMKVNGVSVPFEVTGSLNSIKMTYVPPTSLPSRQTNTIWVSATDDYGTTTTSGTFYVTSIDASTRQPAATGSVNLAAAITNPRQPVSVKLFNTASSASVVMTLDGSVVAHTYDPVSRTVSYTPSADLAPGTHTIVVTCNDLWARASTTTWKMSLAAPLSPAGTDGPVFTSRTPVQDSTVTGGSSLTVRSYVNDPDELVAGAGTGYITRSDGTMFAFTTLTTLYYLNPTSGYVGASIPYTGSWPEDVYTAQLAASDTLGNRTLDEWSFTVRRDDPLLVNETPYENSAIFARRPTISLRAHDLSTGIDADSVRMTVDGTTVTPALTPYVGIGGAGYDLSYVPPSDLAYGGHTVHVECSDGIGQSVSMDWSFIIEEPGSGPTFLTMTPSYDWIYVTVADADGLDGASGTIFLRQGSQEWHPSSTTYTETSGTDGTFGQLKAYIPNAGEGVHEVVVSMADSSGTTSTATYYTTRNMVAPTINPVVTWSPPGYITDPLSPVTVRVTDLHSCIETSSLEYRVDGVAVPFTVSAVDALTADLTWTPTAPLSESVHVFSVDAADVLGNAKTSTWNTDVRVPPALVSMSPANGETLDATTSGATMEIVYDDVTGVETSTVQWLVDGRAITPDISIDGSRYTFTYDWDPGEGLHSSSISLADVRGGATSEAWTFNVDVAGTRVADMSSPDNDVCLICHVGADEPGWNSGNRGYRGTVGGFAQTHRIRAGTTPVAHNSSCTNCHQHNENMLVSSTADYCKACHDSYATTDAHGPSFDYSWAPVVANPTVYAVDAPREQFDCTYCHQRVEGERIVGHDVRAEHAIALDSECGRCHVGELTREHASEGRRSASGDPVDCYTCHQSMNPVVQSAYTRPDTLITYGQIVNGQTSSEVVGSAFSIPGEQIVGATMDIHELNARWGGETPPAGIITVEAYYDGLWNQVYTEDYTDPPNWMFDPLNVEERRELSFPAAEQVRVRLSFSGADHRGPLDVMLFDWQLAEEPADVECATCHVGPSHEALHAGTFDAVCADCHDSNLFTEHLVDRELECGTCHDSASAAVAAAILAGDTACIACHENADHVDLHDANVTRPSCERCHSPNLVIEHVANVGAYCSVCHTAGYGTPVASRTPAPLAELAGEMAASIMPDAKEYHTESGDVLTALTSDAKLPNFGDTNAVTALDASGFTCGSCHDPEPHGSRDDCESCHGPLPYSTNESTMPTATSPAYTDWDDTGANAAVPTPHKGYTSSTNKCAVCHGVHKSAVTGEMLLRTKVVSACEYCHIDTAVGGIRIYGGVSDTYWSVASGQAHNRTSESSCVNCHSVHGSDTLEGANATKILHDWPMDGTSSSYSTPTLEAYPDPASMTDDNDQITAWCTGCHKFYTRSYNETLTTTVFDHEDDYKWEWNTSKSHIMTDLAGGYANPAGTVGNIDVAWASSSTCRSCHDAGATNQGAGVHTDSFPHYTEGYFRFMSVGESLVSSGSPSADHAVDGACLKCHRPAAGAGVGYDF